MQHRTPYLSLIARSGYWTMTDPTLSRLSMSSLNPNLQNRDTTCSRQAISITIHL